jgi:uncharacterized membrane protein
MLLAAQQGYCCLSVCLSCWQKCGWWPDAVGAVLGEYPSASAAMNQIAAEETAARAKVRHASNGFLVGCCLLKHRCNLRSIAVGLVCLRLSCWQKCGWWPGAVGAVLGEYPSASATLNQIAAEKAAARAKVRHASDDDVLGCCSPKFPFTMSCGACNTAGVLLSACVPELLCPPLMLADMCPAVSCCLSQRNALPSLQLYASFLFMILQGEAGALPAPPPRQGPRQLLSALMALGDMCPAEWPPPGGSQAAAAAAEAAAAAGRPAPSECA